MATQREKMLDTVKSRLWGYAGHVKGEHGKLSDGAEELFRGLLNKMLDCKLQNMNLKKENYPGIDLGDESKGVKLCVQVTSTGTRDKVMNTLEKFFKYNLHTRFKRLIILVIGDVQKFPQEPELQHEFDFQTKRDIWDTGRLIREIEALDDEHFEKVAAYLNKELRDYHAEPVRERLLDLPLRTAMDAEHFVGREGELAEIGEKFKKQRIVVLSGLGGMGKTELAVRFAQNYGGGAVYFAGFRKDFFHTVTDEIALGIEGLAEQKLDEQEKYRAVLHVLRKCGRDDLLILDNADTEQESFEGLRRDLSVLPMRILITTRCDAVGAVDVASLHREELHRIFRQYTQEVSEADMDALIDAVDAHTLTVDLMARSMRPGRRSATPEKMLNALQSRDLTSESFMKVATNYPGGPKQARINEHLKTVFQVADLSDAEQELLRYATLLPVNGMDDELFLAALEKPEAEDFLGPLLEMLRKGQTEDSPVETQEDINSFLASLLEKLQQEQKADAVPETPIKAEDTLDDLIAKGWLLWKDDLLKIHPVIRIVCREELKPTDENCGAFLDGLWDWYDPKHYDKDQYRQLAELFSVAADDLEDQLGKWALRAGRFWKELGEAQQALVYELQMVKKREQNQPDSNELAAAYNNVGGTYGDLGDHQKALEYKLKALAIWEKVLPPDHPSLAVSYNNVGSTYGDLGDHEKALEYKLKALAIRENVLPPEHPSLATFYNNVGSTYGDLGDHKKALEYMLKALTIREKVLTPEHPDLATSCDNVGSTYGDLGDHEKALEYQLKALAIREKILPPDHPSLAISYNNVGSTYYALGDYEKALEYNLKALAIREKVLPPEHPDLANSYNNVGGTYGDLGDHEKELEYNLKALAIREKVLPPEHPDLATSYNNVGGTYGNLGDHNMALEYMLKALTILERVLPSEHPYNVMCCGNIAVICAQMDDFASALEYADKALEKAERSMQGHPDLEYYRQLAQTMKQLAEMQAQGIPFENPFK